MLTEYTLVAIGPNPPTPTHGSPRAPCEAALAELSRRGLRIVRRSRWYESAPVPLADQPWYVNGVVAVGTDLPPEDLLALLHDVERQFGRQRRGVEAAPRVALRLLAVGWL